jgi:hypothetical protein
VFWHRKLSGSERTFQIHWDEDVMRSFSEKLSDTRMQMPEFGQSFRSIMVDAWQWPSRRQT